MLDGATLQRDLLEGATLMMPNGSIQKVRYDTYFSIHLSDWVDELRLGTTLMYTLTELGKKAAKESLGGLT
jgi:hypothetical protein